MTEPAGSFDGGSYGTDTGTGTDSSSPADTVAPVAPVVDAPAEPSYNPAWTPVFDKLPHEFHNMIAPELSTWDRNYSELQNKYKPWEDLGQPYEQVKNNLDVIQQMNDNPQAFYNRLGELIGVTPGQVQQPDNSTGVGQDQNYQGSLDGTDQYDLVDPEVARLRQAVDSMQAQQQQWQQERDAIAQQAEVARYQQKADEHINRLAAQHAQQYPSIPFNPAAIVKGVLLQTYQNPEAEPDIDRAYAEYLELATAVRSAPRPGNSAPNVINPNGGGMPPGEYVNPATATSEQRKAMVAQMLANQRT